MPAIEGLMAREILDSRGRPTLWARCTLAGGATAAVSVPSGASTGAAEAHELRDRDPARYSGLGCRRAAANVGDVIFPAVRDRVFATQVALDAALLEIDGSPTKANLGANAVLAVSLAVARATAVARGQPLYQRFAEILAEDRPGDPPLAPSSPRLPRPTVNLFSGGKHAGGQMAIQDVLIAPVSATTVDEAMTVVAAVYAAAAAHCRERYGTRALVADEGGLAPDFPSVAAALDDAVVAIQRAGFVPGREVAICLDVAASHFFADGRYDLDGTPLDSAALITLLAGPGGWLDRYPIISVEDGLAEDDWDHWPALRGALAGRALTLGDDLLCTQPARIARAIDARAADALLLKVNQIGTVSEAASAYRLARAAGWRVVVSARSGETEDDWLADLAVGWGGDALKVGSITRSERLAKWNRLLLIEDETGWPMADSR